MKEDPAAHFTTMLDLYRLSTDFPRFEQARILRDSVERAHTLETGMREHFGSRLSPHIQVHEFEALLFAVPEAFGNVFPGARDLVPRLIQIREGCGGPERIDDGQETAPSKRIESLVLHHARVNYSKVAHGSRIAADVGLERIRAACPHFDAWICGLEALATDR